MTEEESPQDLVPESLLAFAKDHRYIRQCQELLSQVFTENVDTTDLWWWSALLYATIVVGRKGRTLGMEFVGLQHAETSRWQQRMGKLVMLAGWGLWMKQCIRLERSHVQEQRHERLRGAARQYFYEQQRRAMMQRASRTALDNEEAALSHALNPQSNSNETSSDFVYRMKTAIKRVVQIMSEAISKCSDNPHALPDTTALLSIGRWILRLHLAHYCITGKYPTWWHRFLNVKMKRSVNTSRISEPPPTTHSLVGRLILIQAGATLTQTLTRWVVSYIASKRTIQSEESNHGESAPDAVASSSSQQLCGICRMPRLHSAASSSCGHVFCWKCLYQWTSTVRPECPLCRSACRPQDIVALHNYAPSSS